MTYYEILEVAETASNDVIKMAHKALVKKYHPDVFAGDPAFAEEKMKKINEAYEVLSNPAMRKQYDSQLKSQRQNAKTHAANDQSTKADPTENQNTPKATKKSTTKRQTKRPSSSRSALVIIICLIIAFLEVWHPYAENIAIAFDAVIFYGLRDFSLMCIVMMALPVLIGSIWKDGNLKVIRVLSALWVISTGFYISDFVSSDLGWWLVFLFLFVNKHTLIQIHYCDCSRWKAMLWTAISELIVASILVGCVYLLNANLNSTPNKSSSDQSASFVDLPAHEDPSQEELLGLWEIVEYRPDESVHSLLESIDFYEEEIALIDLSSLAFQRTLILTENNRYYMGYDPEDSVQYAQVFFESVFEDLYTERKTLEAVYDIDLASMDKDTFLDFYAEMYEADSFDILVANWIDNLFYYTDDEYAFAYLDEGTYSIDSNRLHLQSDTDSESFNVSFKLDSNYLYLSDPNTQRTYTKSLSAKQMVAIRTITINSEDDFSAELWANLIYKEWENGGSTEEMMLSLMDEHGADQGGGVIRFIEPGDYIDEINDWCFSPDRKVGDAAIIENVYGHTICYISFIL